MTAHCWMTKSWLDDLAKLSDTKAICASVPGATVTSRNHAPLWHCRSLSSSSGSSSVYEPRTPSDNGSLGLVAVSTAPSSPPLTLHEKRKGKALAEIFIPISTPVPDVYIEKVPERVFESLATSSQTFGPWLLPQPQGLELPRPDFVILEAFPTSQFYGTSSARSLPFVREPISIRATIPPSHCLRDQHRDFLRFSSFLDSNPVRAIASRVLAIDITLPHGYRGAWATDLDYLPDTFDASNPNLTFPNLVSFRWQGARLAQHGLPAPYYDFNALPLAQLREVVIKDTPISIPDAHRLLDVCPALEEVELNIMKDGPLLDDLALTLECPQLRSLNISSCASLEHFFCLLDAPRLRQVVYAPLGDTLTIYTFPWNAVMPSLEQFVLVGSENVDEEVYDILEEACEGDNVRLEVLLDLEDTVLL